jgi:hypothetical protein
MFLSGIQKLADTAKKLSGNYAHCKTKHINDKFDLLSSIMAIFVFVINKGAKGPSQTVSINIKYANWHTKQVFFSVMRVPLCNLLKYHYLNK